MKKISVIMPVYNVEKYIQDSIESVLNQTYPNIELIIVDDKSTDSSSQIAARYAAKYPNVKLIANAKNALVGYSRNIGVLNATGDYIAFIDGDDMYAPRYLEKLAQAIEENHVSISMCKYRQFVGRKCTLKDKKSPNVEVIDLEQKPEFLTTTRGYCWNKLYRRELFDTLSFPSHITFEDIPFTYPMFVLWQKIAFVDEELYHYRRNVTGITITNKRIPQRGILDIYYAAAELNKNYQLVKNNDKLDRRMQEIMHSVLYISALDASCWVQLPHKDYKRIINLFVFLANRKYNLTIDTNEQMQQEMKSRLLYLLRIKLVEVSIDKKFYTEQSDEEILEEIGHLIDQYVNPLLVEDVKEMKK